MKFGTHEAMEVHEVLSENTCMIDHYAMYLNQCQDPELRRVLERQQRHMIDTYNTMVNVMQGQGIDVSSAPRITMSSTTRMTGENQTDYGIQQASPVMPRPESKTLSDRAISMGALVFHKCGAVRSTNAALECANPNLRNLLTTAARSCMEMSHEIFQYMHQKGWYPVPAMPENVMSQMQQTYQPAMTGYGGQTGFGVQVSPVGQPGQTGQIGQINQYGH
jgi:spore coat protein CotF